jgi:hypothetical protein
MNRPGSTEEAELASVVATLEDLHQRLGAMATRLAAESQPREDVVAALYEAERSVLGSVRSVAKARRHLQ